MVKEFFEITSISRDDLIGYYEDNDNYLKIINNLDDGEMEYFAKKMADAYCSCCFHMTAKILFEELFLQDKKEKV